MIDQKYVEEVNKAIRQLEPKAIRLIYIAYQTGISRAELAKKYGTSVKRIRTITENLNKLMNDSRSREWLVTNALASACLDWCFFNKHPVDEFLEQHCGQLNRELGQEMYDHFLSLGVVRTALYGESKSNATA